MTVNVIFTRPVSDSIALASLIETPADDGAELLVEELLSGGLLDVDELFVVELDEDELDELEPDEELLLELDELELEEFELF